MGCEVCDPPLLPPLFLVPSIPFFPTLSLDHFSLFLSLPFIPESALHVVLCICVTLCGHNRSIILSRSWGRGIEDDDLRNSSSNATVATWGDDSGHKNSSNSNKTVKNVHTLAPAADMPNHSNEGHQALKAPDGSLVLRAGVDVPAGGQVRRDNLHLSRSDPIRRCIAFSSNPPPVHSTRLMHLLHQIASACVSFWQIMISYGLKCDAEVLSTYGFVPFNNSHVPCHNESLPSTGEKKEQEIAWRKSWR